jgi:hypothetical protein
MPAMRSVSPRWSKIRKPSFRIRRMRIVLLSRSGPQRAEFFIVETG